MVVERIIVFDTETTGLFNSGDEHDFSQPWPVQLGAVIMDGGLNIVQEVNTLIKVPEGVPFHPKAIETHKITPELCANEGRPIEEVIEEFTEILNGCALVAAYNLPYDFRVMRTTGHRIGANRPVFHDNITQLCLMQQVQRVFGRKIKLGKAYEHFLGKEIQDAHDAFADTIAAAELLRHFATKLAD